MTQQRRDDKSTEFGLWLRKQPEIDSRNEGFSTTNIDYIWSYYREGYWMLLEEKRYRYLPKWSQVNCYKLVDLSARLDASYRGLHFIIFENTNPDDGAIWLDGRYISRNDLIKFLRFEQSEEWYMSYYPPTGLIRIPYPEVQNGVG